jgi:predicted anti-sigma-YlaC factor YlaD
MMNQQNCDQYTEWMSLAQDGMLTSTQTRLLHGHLSVCPPCQTTWEAMTAVSQMLHAAPMVAPSTGFAERVQKKFEYRQERRRRIVIGLILGFGALAMLLLALPTLVNAALFAGRLFLPYPIVAYGQGVLTWINAALRALNDAAWVIVRFAATNPTVQASLATGAVAGASSVLWIRFVVRQRTPQRQKIDRYASKPVSG